MSRFIETYLNELPQIPKPEDLELFLGLAVSLKPKSPHFAFQKLDFILVSPTPVQWPPPLFEKPLPPEFIALAHNHDFTTCWGYLVDDPVRNSPKQLARYCLKTGVGCALPTYHVLSAILDIANDLIEDIEEALQSEEDIGGLYQLAELIIATYSKIPRKNKGMISRNQTIVAPTLDGFGLSVPPKTIDFLSPKELLQKHNTESFDLLKEKAKQALIDGYAGLALFYGRNLWFQIKNYPTELQEVSQILSQAYEKLNRHALSLRVKELTKAQKEQSL